MEHYLQSKEKSKKKGRQSVRVIGRLRVKVLRSQGLLGDIGTRNGVRLGKKILTTMTRL